MNIHQLRYALALKKYGNYSRAAKALNISQPAISLQIKNLETELGTLLFDRSQKPIGTTFAGEKFLNKAQELIGQFHQLESFAMTLRDDYSGAITIGIIPTLAPYLIPLFIGDIKDKYPKLQITIKEIITEQILVALRDGDIQLGIISTPIESTMKFDIKPIFYEKFQLFISDSHDLSRQFEVDIEDIDADDLWLLKEGNCFRDQVNNLCGYKKANTHNHTFSYESNSIEALCRIVEHQGGLTFVPELCTIHLDDDRLDLLKDISGHDRVREISLISIPNESRYRFIEKINDSLQSNIPTHRLHNAKGEVIKIEESK